MLRGNFCIGGNFAWCTSSLFFSQIVLLLIETRNKHHPEVVISSLGTYVHSVQQRQQKSKCMVGKYGALVAFRRMGDASTEFRADDVGRRLCQHIVGMSPLTVGEHAPATEGKCMCGCSMSFQDPLEFQMVCRTKEVMMKPPLFYTV